MSIPKRLVLKDTHPTMVKFNKLYALAEELGISISFYNHTAIVEDKDREKNLPPLHLEYVDGSDFDSSFPPVFEYKLVYDNPAYLEEQRRLLDERVAKQETERLATETKLKEANALAEKKRQEQFEARERAELARLQEKYKNESSNNSA